MCHLFLSIHVFADCIENNIDTAEETVDQGVKELRKTNELSVIHFLVNTDFVNCKMK